MCVPAGCGGRYPGVLKAGRGVGSAPTHLVFIGRNVKPDESEWVESTKIVGKSPASIREEELRRRALRDKELEMARLKKDMVSKILILGLASGDLQLRVGSK